jgi:hypothetical protein
MFAQVAGKPFKKFIENQNRVMKTWVLPVNGTMYRVVLEKDTLDIWVNGTKVSFMPRQMLFFPCVQKPHGEKTF